MSEQTKIEVHVRKKRVMYPKNGVYQDNDFAIVTVDIDNVIEGDPKVHPIFGTLTLKGNMPYLEQDGVYRVIGIEEYDDKYKSYNYKVEYIQEVVNFDSVEGQREFLLRFVSEKQVDAMFEALENPIKAIENGNVEELCKVKGIGKTMAQKILDRFAKCKDFARAYIELGKFGLTTTMINKLCSHYGNADRAVTVVQDNPYVLADEVNGIGFKKADEIAMSMGVDPHSVKRGKAFITYFLETEAQKGNSFVYTDILMDGIMEHLGYEYPDEAIRDSLQGLVKDYTLWHNVDKTMLALRKYYTLECNIAKELVRLRDSENQFNFENWEDKVHALEEKQGWKHTDEQLDGIRATLEHNVVLITGLAGCVDMDTEYFNGHEWKKISDYSYGEKVLQYNVDGTTSLVVPHRYIKEPQDTLYHIQSKYGIDQCLSLDHEVAYVSSKGNLITRPLSHVKKLHESNLNGFGGKFITTFNYGGVGIDLDEHTIRLMVAIMADGSFSNNSELKCSINVKKQRKKDRLEFLLNNAKVMYKKRESSVDGYHVYTFNAPIRTKHYPKDWYNCTNEQLQIIIDEMVHWDGAIKKGSPQFYTTNKSCADFIQFALSSCGYRATIRSCNRVGKTYYTNNQHYIRKSKEYTVMGTKRNLVGIGGFHKDNPNRPKFEEVKTKDGYQYCFTVPSELLVLRRNDKIFITGNCGKTATVKGMVEVLGDHYKISQCALSGKAAVNLEHATNYPSSTIHRLLGYAGGEGFAHNKETKLDTDIVILDELSMVDAPLFYSLIQAIRSGAKLIMLGDMGQLENIGVGNIIYDLIDSGVIQHVHLTKVHRQASKSAIITKSKDIRESKQIVNSDFEGELTLGELQDLHLVGYQYNSYSQPKNAIRPTIDLIVEKFKEKLKLTDNINDIMVLLPTKSRGSSCYVVNAILQDIVLPTRMLKGLVVGEKSKEPYTLYKGDKVINLVNDKNAIYIDKEGNEISRPIFNGNMGIIQSIDYENSSIVVDFEGVGLVTIPKANLTNIALGYCITTHKSQGSGVPYVICGVDNTHYVMLTREMIYTMITRAKKHCDLIFETQALIKAIKTTNVAHKQTFLPYFLNGTLDMNKPPMYQVHESQNNG